MTPGTVTIVRATWCTISATATAATGGTGAVSVQWQLDWTKGTAGWVNAVGAGTTTLAAVLQGVAFHTAAARGGSAMTTIVNWDNAAVVALIAAFWFRWRGDPRTAVLCSMLSTVCSYAAKRLRDGEED